MLTEWLETDQRGGYGMGTSNLIPTRRYHALYVCPDQNSERRSVLLHTPQIEINIHGTWHSLSSFRFFDGTVHPDGSKFVSQFTSNPWPTWEFDFEGCVIRYEFLLLETQQAGFLRWSIVKSLTPVTELRIRPFLSMRDHHHLTAKNRYPEQPMRRDGNCFCWSRDEHSPTIYFSSIAQFHEAPLWYENFSYIEEQKRGYDSREDLFSPGFFEFSGLKNSVVLKFAAQREDCLPNLSGRLLAHECESEIGSEAARRNKTPEVLARAATDYKVRRNGRASIIAGYPWFSDWGRDTFISIRGLCYAVGDYAFAKEIIFCWRETVKDGLIPNRFPDTAEMPEYNSIDATLWYLVAIGELLGYAQKNKVELSASERAAIIDTAQSIIKKLIDGTRYNIAVASDGLLQGGVAGKQLTWMDAKVGDWVVTPRIGKPVEIQALWINALKLLNPAVAQIEALTERAVSSFEKRFWLADLGYLADVVDVDHTPGEIDFTFRPNQVLALGGLPFPLISGEKALRVLKKVEHELLTPYGLRTLSPSDTRYHGQYRGDTMSRDAAYHQGTVWPWLITAYVDAIMRAKLKSPRVVKEKILAPLTRLALDCGGHVPEIFEAALPHQPVGAPFQAWSLGELLRANQMVSQPKSWLIALLERLI